jgi:hypothetical protein
LGDVVGQVGGLTLVGETVLPGGVQSPGGGIVVRVVPVPVPVGLRIAPFGATVPGAVVVVPLGSVLEPSGVWFAFGIWVVGVVGVWLALGIGVVWALAAPSARTRAAPVRIDFIMCLSPCWRENVCGRGVFRRFRRGGPATLLFLSFAATAANPDDISRCFEGSRRTNWARRIRGG